MDEDTALKAAAANAVVSSILTASAKQKGLIVIDLDKIRAQIEHALEGAYAPEGFPAWWARPRHQLNGRSPNQAWEDGDYEQVLNLALSLQGSGAT